MQQGFEAALKKGPLGEFPVVGVSVTLRDGSYHEKDSSDSAFRQCASETMRKVILPNAELVLYEPVMKLEIEVPAEFQGAIASHLAKHRGVVTNTDSTEANCVIHAEAPLAELFDYASDFRSMTQGQGSFTMQFLAFKQTPRQVQEDVIAKRQELAASRG